MMVEKFFFRKFNKSCAFLMLLLFAAGPLWAGHSPEKITLKVTNEKLVKVLEEIKKQSGYNFVYNEKFVKDLGGITVDVKEVSLDSVMKEVLKGTGLRYRIQDRIILLEKAPQVSNEKRFREIKGKVRDDRNESLPGVTVLIKGTSIGVSTDIDGNFSLNVPEGNDLLLISFVGMETLEVNLKGKTMPLDVVLKPKADELDEVVVTGYTQTTKRRSTGSVGIIKKEVFENRPVSSVDNLLQGQIAGVSVLATSGRPGASSKIRIRGTNTLTGNAEPLWVVDGVPLQKDIPDISAGQIKSGDFDNIFTTGLGGINPNDIESVTVLKDASAAAIYGSRAAGGVIVVTTKQGKAGKMKVNYSANVSIVLKPQRDMNLMNSREKLAWEQELWDEFSAKGFNSGTYYPVVGIVGMIRSGKDEFKGMSVAEQDAYIEDLASQTTDWVDILFRNSFSMSHHLSLSGGKEEFTYYLSFGYSNEKGTMKNNAYNRYNVSSKINLRPVERLNLQFGVDLASQKSDAPSMNVNPLEYAYYANPYERPYNEDGSYRGDYTYFTLNRVNGGFTEMLPEGGVNILREMEETSSDAYNTTVDLRFSVDYRLLSKFRVSGIASYSFTNNKTDNINGKESYAAFLDRLSFDSYPSTRTYGSITQTSANNSSYMARFQLGYDDLFNDQHRIGIIAGAEIRGDNAKSIYEKRYGYDDVTGNSSIPLPPKTGDNISYNQLISFGRIVDGLSGQSRTENRFASFYSAVDYTLRDKYMVSLSFRTDGSNNFGSDEQFNPTWSLGAAWHIGDEGFMQRINHVLSRLKLSLAMGYTGNINKTVKPNLIMSYESDYRKADNDMYRMGWIKNAPNPKLKWEKTRDMKVALDFGLFRDRISGVVEGYYRKSINCVTSVNVPVMTGFSSQSYNTSELENKGIEGTIRATILEYKGFRWNMSANIAWNQNKLTKYESPTGHIYGNLYVGYPLGAVFGGKTSGIDPTTGLYKFKLRSDAVINKETDYADATNYRFYLGTSTAPTTGVFNLNFSYKQFALNIGGAFTLGAKLLNDLNTPASYSSISVENKPSVEGGRESIPMRYNDLYVSHLNVRKDVVNRWRADQTVGTKYPRILDRYGERLYLDRTNPSSTDITNGALLENVSFLRVRDITFTYSLPENILKKISLSSMSFYLSMNNFITITNYSGIDPETPGATYPVTRSVSFGLNIGF